MPCTIFAATTNPGKLREFAHSASTGGIAVLPLPNLADLPEPVEDALTFAGNAALKARAYSHQAPGLLVMADDSGLEVDALGGAPGVRSARYAADLAFTPDTSHPQPGPLDPVTRDGRNNLCLLAQLSSSSIPQRTARFRCSLALARDGQLLLEADATVEGEILRAPRGDRGFGYDPLFWIPELQRTAAELSPDQKWRVSHRGRAFRALLDQLPSTPF